MSQAPRDEVSAAGAARLGLEATLLWPLGMVALTGLTAFLGPSVTRQLGGEPTGLGRLLLWSGAHRPVMVVAGLVVLVAGVAGFRSARVQGLFTRGGLTAQMAGRLVLFLPLVASIGLLLWSVLGPVTQALSVGAG